MGLEGQAGSDVVVVAAGIVHSRVLLHRELVADIERAVERDASIPDGKTSRVTVVAGVGIVRNSTEQVKLLAGVVGMDIDAVARDVINGVIHRPNVTRSRVLSNSDGIANTPAKKLAIRVEVEGIVAGLAQVKGLDLGVAAGGIEGINVKVLVDAAGHDEPVARGLGHDQGARGLVVVGHVVNDDGGFGVDGAGLCVVGPGEHLGYGRGVQGLAIF